MSRIAWFLAVLLMLPGGATSAVEPPGPNIVLILADDLGHGHVSHLNPKSKIKTPHIDKLAAEGITLTDAHSGSAVCSPTRYGILTGRYAWRTRLVRGVLGPYDPPLIEADRLTLPALLRQKGYHTACIGKWHLGWDWPRPRKDADPDFTKPIPGGPTSRGFDYYFGTDVPNYPPYCFLENDRTVGQPTAMKTERNLDGRPGPMLPGWKFDAILPALADKATGYLADRAKDGKRFFLYLPLTSPHEPIAPSADFRGKSGLNPLGDFMIETDAVVGRIVEALENNRLARNTLVVFTGDNGSSMYTGGAELKKLGHEPSATWRGAKASIYEGGHRVPLVARWPGVIPAGARSAETVCLTDLMATFVRAAGADLPGDAAPDSFDILPALRGDKLTAPIREATVHQSAQGQLAIRQGRWKLILAPEGKSPATGTEPKTAELYDLTADPGETKNVHDANAVVVTRLSELLAGYRTNGRSRP